MIVLEKQLIKTIHVVHKTHLDIGFTDFAGNIKARYLDDFLPKAMALGRELDQKDEQFVWTTGSWLIYEALESYKGKRLKALEESLASGAIAWHGLPFTTHTELMDASLFRFGLSLSKDLDTRFGKKTIAAKMTDVPGHTRAMVPLLAEAGIKVLHIGVNPASTPNLPKIFVWRHTDGSEITVIYDAKDYGGTTLLPDISSGLVIVHTGDNLGPPSYEDIVDTRIRLKKEFPHSRIVSSRLDDFANKLHCMRQTLPVVTAEIGDTWIHGVATDPTKVAKFLELARLRKNLSNESHGMRFAKKYKKFSRFLLLVPEHTWGMDEKIFLQDNASYKNANFKKLRRTKACRRFESSWQEQRMILNQATESFVGTKYHKQVVDSLALIKPKRPKTDGFSEVIDKASVFCAEPYLIAFDPNCGTIIRLQNTDSGISYASPKYPLASYQYERFTGEDYENFKNQYLRPNMRNAEWAINDFTKPGIEKLKLKPYRTKPILNKLWYKNSATETKFILEMSMPAYAVYECGAAAEMYLEINIPINKSIINLTFQWFRKSATRLPEASWLSFNPKVKLTAGWTIQKMGEWIDPVDVVNNGNRKVHAVESVRHTNKSDRLTITPLDTPVVALGHCSLLKFNNYSPALSKGIHFNLHNNIWGTNFPMWFEDDAKFRFKLRFS